MPSNGLTTTDLVRMFGISRQAISRHLRSGRLKGVRDANGRWVVAAADAELFLSEMHSGKPFDYPGPSSSRYEETGAAFDFRDAELALLRAELAEAKLKSLTDRVSDLERENARLRAAVAALAGTNAEE